MVEEWRPYTRSALTAGLAEPTIASAASGPWTHEGCFEVEATWNVPRHIIASHDSAQGPHQPQLAASDAAAAHQGWRRFDIDRDGSISRAELRAGLRRHDHAAAAAAGRGDSNTQVPVPLSVAALDAHMRELDSDGDGAISSSEYVSWAVRRRSRHSRQQAATNAELSAPPRPRCHFRTGRFAHVFRRV